MVGNSESFLESYTNYLDATELEARMAWEPGTWKDLQKSQGAKISYDTYKICYIAQKAMIYTKLEKGE